MGRGSGASRHRPGDDREHGGGDGRRPRRSSPPMARTRAYLQAQGRGEAWVELSADRGAAYDEHEEIDLSRLEPLIACPQSPGNVVPAPGRGDQGAPGHRREQRQLLLPGPGGDRPDSRGEGGEPRGPRSTSTRGAGRCWRTSCPRAAPRAPAVRGRDQRARLPRLHRHGPGARDGAGKPANLPEELPRALGDPGRPGLPLLPGDAAAAALTGVITDPRDLAGVMAYPRSGTRSA